jgi:hypothetical protein
LSPLPLSRGTLFAPFAIGISAFRPNPLANEDNMQLLLLAQNTGVPDVVGGIFSMALVFWILSVIATIFWVWMLIDALVNERTTEEKLLWFLVIFLLHFIGAVIYYAVRKSGRGSSLVR